MSWTASQRDRGPSSDGVAAAADELEEPAHLGLELQRRDLLAVEEAAQFIGRVACPREPALRRGRAGDAERRQPRELVLLVLPAGVAEMAQRRVAHQREGAPVVLDLRLRGRVALGRKAMAMAVQPDLDAGCLQLACLLQSHEGAEALRFYRRGIDVEGRAETAKQRLARLGAPQGFGVFIQAMPRRRPLRLV